ncbi:MAG: hypothetical protein HFJ30_00815 [Clostridia bacterium]|nr:hypothetical protein [Clostridia bacterium]
MRKRFLAMLMAVAMCMGMTTAAFAAAPTLADEETFGSGVAVWDEEEQAYVAEIDASAMPLGADGNATWSSSNYTYVGEFEMLGNNLTPVKTMGKSGRLMIYTFFSFKSGTGYVVTQIKNASTGKVLAENNRYANGHSPTQWQVDKHGDTVETNVTKGQKVQIFFRILSDTGRFQASRTCFIRYYYSLT